MRLLLAVIAAITSSSIAAATVPATAQLAAVPRVAAVVSGTGLWRCEGTTCTGMAAPAPERAVVTCTDLAGGAGRVAAFTVGEYSFTEADLARCNRRVKP